MKYLIAVALLAASAAVHANQSQYREEIIEQVINPCFTVSLRMQGGEANADTLKIMRSLYASMIEEMMQEYLYALDDLNQYFRKDRIYEMGLGACVKGILQE